MLRIKVIMVGRVKESYLQAGIQEYLKRLGSYSKVELTSVPDEPTPDGAGAALEEQVKSREAERILRLIDPGHYVVALDGRGQGLSSEELSAFLAERGVRGQSSLAFVIGGSLGLHGDVLARADFKLSFGRMTFLHQMVPLLLLEQVYRGFKIMRGEPYHK